MNGTGSNEKLISISYQKKTFRTSEFNGSTQARDQAEDLKRKLEDQTGHDLVEHELSHALADPVEQGSISICQRSIRIGFFDQIYTLTNYLGNYVPEGRPRTPHEIHQMALAPDKPSLFDHILAFGLKPRKQR